MLAKMEKYIPNPKRCHNCQKYGDFKAAYSRKPVKCGAHESDHLEVMCTNNLNCSNCKESYKTVSKL